MFTMMHYGVMGKPAPIISTDGCNKVLAWAVTPQTPLYSDPWKNTGTISITPAV